MQEANFICPSGLIHRVERGESLSTIAKRYGIRAEALIDQNPYVDPAALTEGDQLCVPVTVRRVRLYETLPTLAQRAGRAIDELTAQNPDLIPLPGQRFR